MRHFILFIALSITIGCNQSAKKKTTQAQEEVVVAIPDSLLGKDWDGNEILVGKISYAQMTQYSAVWFDKEYDLYHCDCPKEILEMVVDESNVYWDCSWQASYNNGKVTLKLNEEGEILYITRTYPE